MPEPVKSQNPQVLFFAGALCGVTEALAVQPFDMVKTRHQLNPGLNESVYGTLVSLYAEGGVGRFYRGMLPELIGMVPKSSGNNSWSRSCNDPRSSAAIAHNDIFQN